MKIYYNNWKEKAEEWRKKAEIFFIMKENSAKKTEYGVCWMLREAIYK